MLATELQAPEIAIELPREIPSGIFDQIQSNNQRLQQLERERLDRFAEIIKDAKRGKSMKTDGVMIPTKEYQKLLSDRHVLLEACKLAFPHIEALMLDGGCSNDIWKTLRAAIAQAEEA